MRECGDILDVTGSLSEDSPMSSVPMGILDHIFKALIRFKKLNQVGTPMNKVLTLLCSALYCSSPHLSSGEEFSCTVHRRCERKRFILLWLKS